MTTFFVRGLGIQIGPCGDATGRLG